jgi:Protein of unknown function (DUF2530)
MSGPSPRDPRDPSGQARPGREVLRRREAPPPLEGDARVITLTLTGAWVAALIIVVLLRHHLPDPHRWIWTCVTGVGLGLFGLFYVPRLMRSRERAASRRGDDPQPR